MWGIFQNTILLIYTQVTSFFNSWKKCLLNNRQPSKALKFNRQPLKLEKKLTVNCRYHPITTLLLCSPIFALYWDNIIQTEMLQDVLPGSSGFRWDDGTCKF